MSTIGRIFVVINLVLAGVFVGFASTYLQQAHDWKTKYSEEVKGRATEVATITEQLTAANSRYETANGKLLQSQNSLKRTETRNGELVAENERLDGQLARVESTLETMKGDFGTVSSTIERAQTEYTSSVKLALTAQADRDEAVRAKEVAVADLADANNTIQALRETVEARESTLAMAEANIREKEILLSNVAQMVPGTLMADLAMPSLKGAVQHVSGDLLTIVVTDNPASAEIKAGYRFAIAGGGNYKGEAFVTEVDGNTAFCRMTIRKGNASIAVGDAAMTHTN